MAVLQARPGRNLAPVRRAPSSTPRPGALRPWGARTPEGPAGRYKHNSSICTRILPGHGPGTAAVGAGDRLGHRPTNGTDSGGGGKGGTVRSPGEIPLADLAFGHHELGRQGRGLHRERLIKLELEEVKMGKPIQDRGGLHARSGSEQACRLAEGTTGAAGRTPGAVGKATGMPLPPRRSVPRRQPHPAAQASRVRRAGHA